MIGTRFAYANESDLELFQNARQTRVRPSIRLRECDTYQGVVTDPISLHKYLYANANPISNTDPTGHWALGDILVTTGLIASLAAILLPAVHGAYTHAYHVAANGNKESLFGALFHGEATWEDFKRMGSGFMGGMEAGNWNLFDTLTFRQVGSIHEHRNQLWQREGLDQSWVGTVTNGFAWIGTGALYSAAIVYTIPAAGGGTMDVAVQYSTQAPKFVHFEYAVNGQWLQAVGRDGAMRIIAGSGQGIQLTGIPLLLPDSAAAAGVGYNCATTVLRALYAGWKFW